MSKVPFGAGRGATTLQLDPDDIVIITDPDHSRYDHRATLPLSEEFIASLERGQIQPVTVTRDDDGNPQLLDGRQRVLAMREINKRRRAAGQEVMLCTAVYRRVADDAEALAVRHVANVHRPDPISVRARDADRFVQRFGWPIDKVAPIFGVGVRTIEQWRAVLECAAPVLQALDSGRLGLAAAVKLSELSRNEQVSELRKMQDAKTPAQASARKAGKTKSGRPTAGMLRKLARHKSLDEAGLDVRDVVKWAAGMLPTSELLDRIPELRPALTESKD